MEKVTLREYAKRRKLSYFKVMKMVRGGELKSETVNEEGKEVAYILMDDEIEKEITKNMQEQGGKELSLQEENALLKEEILKLKEALERCNRRTILA
ncbi:MAG: hypothetical protein KAG56_11200 [Sulfurovaceae bacterium]|nr:hypothetical protein [Sulfurovaceae bacterium]